MGSHGEPAKLGGSSSSSVNVRWVYRKAAPAIVLVAATWFLASTMLACRPEPLATHQLGAAASSSHGRVQAAPAARPPQQINGVGVGATTSTTTTTISGINEEPPLLLNDVGISTSLPPWVETYPTTHKAPCRWKERATRTTLECFRVAGRIVGFVDPHTRASTFNRMEAWLVDRVPECVHVDVIIAHFVMFASVHMGGAIAALPNPPPVIAVDHSGEVGELDAVNCMFNELRRNLSETRFIFVNQAASLHNPGQRFFNQHWLIPPELERLEEKAQDGASTTSTTAPADTLDRSSVDLQRSRILCLGGFPRTHKVQFLGELDASGLLDRILWSGGTPDAWLVANMNRSLVAYGYTADEQLKAQQLARKLPHVLDVDRGAKKASGMTFHSALYNLADVHLVLESNGRVPSLDRHKCTRTFRYTEKTLKVIYAGARFVVFNDPASLELLRAHGFRTFHPHINETYDAIPTYREKVDAIKLEMERLLAMSEAEYRAFLAATQSIVDYNRQWLLSYGFKARVHQQSLYAYGLSEAPGFTSFDHEQALERMYASLNLNCTSAV